MRFSFEASGLQQAASLTAELRSLTGCPVRVRPASRRLRSPQLWTVALETPPARTEESDIRRWEDSMQDVARRHPGCRFVGWQSVPGPPG